MVYNNHFTGAITITPPLTWAEIQSAPRSAVRITDVRLRVVQDVVDTDTGQIITKSADAIVPLDKDYSGGAVVEDIQAVVDFYGPRGHAFAGYIQAQWDPGFEDPIPQRYVVVDGRVNAVTPTLVWPDDEASRDALLADARALAKVLFDRMRDFVPDDAVFGEGLSWETLPDWMTGDGLGRVLWAYGAGGDDV